MNGFGGGGGMRAFLGESRPEYVRSHKAHNKKMIVHHAYTPHILKGHLNLLSLRILFKNFGSQLHSSLMNGELFGLSRISLVHCELSHGVSMPSDPHPVSRLQLVTV